MKVVKTDMHLQATYFGIVFVAVHKIVSGWLAVSVATYGIVVAG